MPFVCLCLWIVSGLKKIHSISDLGSQVVINDSHERFIMKSERANFPIFRGWLFGLHERLILLMSENFNWQFFFFPIELLTSDAITVEFFIPPTLNAIHANHNNFTNYMPSLISWSNFYWKLLLAFWRWWWWCELKRSWLFIHVG